MKQTFFIFAFCLIYQCLNAQMQDSLFLKKLIGVDNIFLGKEVNPSDYLKFENSKYINKKQAFSPIAVNYIIEDNNLNSSIFENDIVYFNLDSSSKVSSIIFELSNEEEIIRLIKISLGDLTNKIEFKTGNSYVSCKGWIKDSSCIMILTSGKLKLVVFYNCDKKSFLE